MTPLEVLELFNEKAETLRNCSRFMESLRTNTVEFRINTDLGNGEVIYYGPDHELIAAGVNTIRLFILNKDSISFCNMKTIYNNLSISEAKKK